MKTILCFGDSHVRGNIPGGFNPKSGLSARYPKKQRWGGVLQKELGPNFDIIEEGIGGRTTNLDELVPGRPYRNGMSQLPESLEAHYPIDLVILLFGTNDTKLQFQKSVEEITNGMRKLITYIKESPFGPNGTAPKILVIAPPSVILVPNLSPQFDKEAIEKSEKLGSAYQRLTTEEECEFLDSSLIVKASLIDGVHLDESQTLLLGQAISKKVLPIYG